MFFAFAGYARIATLGGEVIDPKTTIPKAIDRSFAHRARGVCADGDRGAGRTGAAPGRAQQRAAGRRGAERDRAVRADRRGGRRGERAAVAPGRRRADRVRDGARAVDDVDVVQIAVAAVVIVATLAFDLRGAIGFSSFPCSSTTRSRTRPRGRSASGWCRSSGWPAAWSSRSACHCDRRLLGGALLACRQPRPGGRRDVAVEQRVVRLALPRLEPRRQVGAHVRVGRGRSSRLTVSFGSTSDVVELARARRPVGPAELDHSGPWSAESSMFAQHRRAVE